MCMYRYIYIYAYAHLYTTESKRERQNRAKMSLNLCTFEMLGGFTAHNSVPSMAVPVVSRASVKWSRKLSVRSDVSSRASAADKIEGNLQMEQEVDEQDYSGTPYVPVYAMLSHSIIGVDHGFRDRKDWVEMLSKFKATNADGVKVECWWGIVESQVPKQYDWSEYKALFQIVRDLQLKLQVVLCFHASGEQSWCGEFIPLPRWVMEVGKKNPDIFFTSSWGLRNRFSLTWGIDDERVLMNRTAYEVYRDFMMSFREELGEFITDGFISNVEIGLGPYGELRFPCPNDTRSRGPAGYHKEADAAGHGWEYPPIEDFECYDKYMMKSLKKAWKERGESSPKCSSLGQVERLSGRRHPYNSFYGRFFLDWYSRVLADHADKLLSLGRDIFSHHCNIAAKIPGICHFWYEPNIHVERLIGGYCNRSECDSPIISILTKYKISLNCTLPELRAIVRNEDFPEALSDEIGLGWQLLYGAWAAGIPVSGENYFPFSDRQGYNEILEIAKPMNDPIGRHLSSFTYLRLGMQSNNQREFDMFVRRMHGESTT